MMFFPFEAQNREQPLLRFRQASEHRLLGLPRRFALLGIRLITSRMSSNSESSRFSDIFTPARRTRRHITDRRGARYCNTNREPAA